jgi:hypothetical protein
MAHAGGGAGEEENAAKRRKLGGEGPGGGGAPAAIGSLRMREKILAVERDYTHYFALDVGGEAGADQYVYQHFNTLCMVGIAPSSLAFAGGRKVTQVDFAVGRGGDKAEAKKPSGKKKHGARYARPPPPPVWPQRARAVCFRVSPQRALTQPLRARARQLHE